MHEGDERVEFGRKHFINFLYICLIVNSIIIITTIAPLIILSEDEWGDLECPYKACQSAKTDGGLFTDAGVNERGEN